MSGYRTGKRKGRGKNKAIQVLTPVSTGLTEPQTRNLIHLGQNAANAFQAGDLWMAEQMCQRSLTVFPNYALAWAILASIKFKTGEFQAAADLMEKSLSILPGVADRWMSYGVILKNLHRYEEALKAVEKSLKIEPKSSKALNNKATTLEVLGRTKESKRVFSQLIQAYPTYGRPFFNFANMHKFVDGDRYCKLFEKLDENVEKLSSVGDQRNAYFALGKYFEDISNYQKAFDRYCRANELSNVGTQYSVATDLEKMKKLQTAFSKNGTWLAGFNELASPSDLPIYIVGMPRSGTTLIEQILSSHPEIHGAGELKVLSELNTRLRIASNDWEGLQSIEAPNRDHIGAEISNCATELVRHMEGLSHGAKHVIDKMPTNFLALGAKSLMLPNAKVIHCKRNPVDTCFSIFKRQYENKLQFSSSLKDLGQFYNGYLELMAHWKNVLPEDQFFEISYEDVVANLEVKAKEIIAFIGVEWDSACLEFYDNTRAVNTASTNQVRQPIYTSAVGVHRHYGELLQPLLEELNAAE